MRLNHPQGRAAETQAWHFLQARGCRLLARNWHCPFGEIDLIVEHAGHLVFVEVRYRKDRRFGGAGDSINTAKLHKLQRSAEYYLQQHPSRLPCRIDAVLLHADEAVQWLTNITA